MIVVGGGMAGCLAARDLRHAGRSVLVLEARDRLGGRTLCATFPGSAQQIELGGTWVCPGDQPHVTREVERYGLGYVQSPSPETFRWRTAGQLRTGLPVPPEELAGLERLVVACANGAARIDFGKSLADPALADLDVSVADFVDTARVAPATRDLAFAWAGLNSGSDPAEYSALNFLQWLAGWHNSVFLSYAALTDKIAGGTSRLIDALIEEASADVRLGRRVREIRQGPDDVVVVVDDGTEARAGAVIVTVPLNVLGTVRFTPALAEAKEQAIAAGHVGHSVKIWALVEGAPERLAACGWGGGLNWLSTEYDTPDGQLMVGFGTDPAALTHDVASVQEAVGLLCPEARVVAVDGHDWVADPLAMGTWTALRAGQAGYGAALREPEGRVYFATADAARRWLGFIEGGLEMGAEAAAAVLGRADADASQDVATARA